MLWIETKAIDRAMLHPNFVRSRGVEIRALEVGVEGGSSHCLRLSGSLAEVLCSRSIRIWSREDCYEQNWQPKAWHLSATLVST